MPEQRAYSTHGVAWPGRRPRPSDEAIAEAQRLMDLPRTTTQELMGDPLPGRSALDKLSSSHVTGGQPRLTALSRPSLNVTEQE